MAGRWIGDEVFAVGIRLFAERAGATFTRPNELVYQLTFPHEKYPTFVGFKGLGEIISYATYCRVVTSNADMFLEQNWGGVHRTCFYFSVHVEMGKPWLFLETRQFLEPDTTSEKIASLLSTWHLQVRQVQEEIKCA